MMGEEKGRNPTNCSGTKWAHYCPINLLISPEFRQGLQVHTGTVFAAYCSAQPVLFWCEVQGTDDTMWYFKVQVQCWQFTVVLSRYFCACVSNIHVCMIHFQSSLQMPNRWASRRKSSLSTNAGDNLFRFASIISPAALKSLSTAVDVAGGVRYLVKKDWIKGTDNSSYIHLLAKATRALPAGPFAI